MNRNSTVYAGHLERLFAYLIDSILLITATKIMSLMFGETGIALILSFAISASYYTYFTASSWQATPGKRLLNMYVIRTDHRALGRRDAFERFLAFILPSLPLYASFIPAEAAPMLVLCLSLAWFAPILFTPQHMAMHDRFCQTRVLVGKGRNMNVKEQMNEIGKAARAAARELALASAGQKSLALAAATAMRANAAAILAANAKDMDAATHLDAAMKDRLKLDEKRIEAMAKGLEDVAALHDPVGRVIETWDVEKNGLHFEKVAVPLGVIGIIYESRPNVTADAAALALKAGNAVILRGGSESFHSSNAIAAALYAGLKEAGLPAASIQLVPTTDREAVAAMLTMNDFIDVIIPRGGKSLTDRVRNDARVPTLLHLDGNCHLYIDKAADDATAHRVTLNAKLRRTGICGALETLLIHQDCLTTIAPVIIADLLEKGCELRGDAFIQKLDARIKPATEEDWATEYLAPILAIKTVRSVEEAIAHINRYGSHHTDAILTEDADAANLFMQGVDSAIVLVNASTQFADGGEFGFGAEIGIATGRLHARGPVGAPELTTYKYRVTTKTPFGAIRAG